MTTDQKELKKNWNYYYYYKSILCQKKKKQLKAK